MDHSDDMLWARCARDDAVALGELFERHRLAIYAYAFRSTGSRERAEDVTSTVFLEAWAHRHVQIGAGKVLSWLYGVATNVMRSERRKLRRHARAVARLTDPGVERCFTDRVAERLDEEDRIRRMLARIADLPRVQRELVVLCWWSGLTYEQAADALEIPVGTVRSRLAAARARLTTGAVDAPDPPAPRRQP